MRMRRWPYCVACSARADRRIPLDIPILPQDAVPLPKDEVRITEVTATPWPDRIRVRVHVRLTAFHERPNLILVAHDEDDRIVSELDVIETMSNDMEFTLHLRDVDDPAGLYTLTVALFYESRNPPQHQVIETFFVPAAESGEEG